MKKERPRIINTDISDELEPVINGRENINPESTALAELRAVQVVNGSWSNIDEVASNLWGSIHQELLDGVPVFAYKASNNNSELVQIVVVRYVYGGDANNNYFDDFGIGMVTTGFTALEPHIPIDQVINEVCSDLKKYKVPTEIRDRFDKIISNLKILVKKNENNTNK